MRRRLRATNGLVLDAWALLAWLGNEPGGGTVDELLRRAEAARSSLLMSIVNAGEVYYRLVKAHRHDDAEEFITDLRRHRLPLQLMPATPRRVWEAARLKARFPIAYADAFAVALSQETGLPLLTGDPDFLPLERAKECTVRWITR